SAASVRSEHQRLLFAWYWRRRSCRQTESGCLPRHCRHSQNSFRKFHSHQTSCRASRQADSEPERLSQLGSTFLTLLVDRWYKKVGKRLCYTSYVKNEDKVDYPLDVLVLGHQHDLPERVASFELAVSLLYVREAVDLGDRNLQTAGLDQLGQLREDLRAGGHPAAVVLDVVLLGRRNVDSGVDPLRGSSQPERNLDVPMAEGVHESVDSTSRCGADPIGDAVAIRQRDHAVSREPSVMRLARQADH